MNRPPSIASRRAILATGLLILALALATGLRATNLAAALGWYGEPACDDLEAQNPGDPNGCMYDARENQMEGAGGLASCADDQDNDSDERTDCADPDCFGEANCGMGEWCSVESAEFAGQSGDCGGDDGVNKCSDEIDGDSDGLVDCADPDCMYGQGTWSTICARVDPVCAEYTCNAGGVGQDEWGCNGDCAQGNCADGQDNDGTGNGVDCADPSCANRAVCQNQVQTENDYTACNDGQDNDGDGARDCDDPDCDYNQTGACWWAYTTINPTNWWPSYETDCGNGGDDDNDGYYDCSDTGDCSADYRCAVNTVPTVTETAPWGYYDPYFCENGGDDDSDGAADCADPDCSGTAACAARPSPVTELDANGDGTPDDPYWGPSCGDGYDNDDDGAVDCGDSDCAQDSHCGTTGGTVTEIQPDGYPVAWYWGNGYCVDGLNNDRNGWVDCWDDLCDGQDPVCGTFTGLGTEGWPYDWQYPNGDPRQGGNQHGVGGPQIECGNGVCDAGETPEACPSDCQIEVGFCGDQFCDAHLGETCESCGQDCGDCRNLDQVEASANLVTESNYLVSAADPEIAGSGDIYAFEVEFQVTAQGGDVYLGKSGMDWGKAPGSNGRTETEGASLAANGTTANDTSTAFRINEGDTRTFTATVVLRAVEDGWSGVQITSLNWGTDSSGIGRQLPLSNFETDLRYMNYIYRN